MTATANKGGKPAADKLLKPVKSGTKRAQFLRWFVKQPRSVESARKRFGMSRQNVFAHLAAIHREHGIGYSIGQNEVTVLLPGFCTATSIFARSTAQAEQRRSRDEKDERYMRRASAELAKLFELFGLNSEVAHEQAVAQVSRAASEVLSSPIRELVRL